MCVTIIALSDTHAATLAALPGRLLGCLREADIIIHAGDLTEMSLLDELRAVTQVVAVSGNMDSTALKLHLPYRQLFSAGGKTIGVHHGAGSRSGIEQRVRALFPEEPDLIVFGHSHVPFCGMVDGVLMLNPGPAAKGYARVEIGTRVTARVIPV